MNYLISRYGTIYVGKVISKTTTKEKDKDGDWYRVQRFKLRVEKSIKGVENEIQDIAIGQRLGSKDSCFNDVPKLKIGEKWIVHRNFRRDDNSRPVFLGFSFSPLVFYDSKYGAEYLEKLEKIVQNPVTAVYGQVQKAQWGISQTKETEVFLSGNGLELSAKLGPDDDYSFENIPAGTYKIQIRFPRQTTDLYKNQKAAYSEQTKTFNFEYEAIIKAGDSDYYFVVTNGVNE